MYHLFLDDQRNPVEAMYYTGKYIYTKEKWDIVRSYDQFVKFITDNGLPAYVSFDHDLSDEHYDIDVPTSEYKEKTGYECAKWLVDYCIDNGYKFPDYFVHSMNPTGTDNIISYIENAKKHTGI